AAAYRDGPDRSPSGIRQAVRLSSARRRSHRYPLRARAGRRHYRSTFEALSATNRDRRSTAARRPVMPLPLILAFLAGGLVVGSFLNVCIHRLPLHESIVWPASHCTTCNRQLAWYENIPVASWLVL